MKRHFTKLAIVVLLMICSTCSNAQSTLSPGDKFLEYLNAHDVKQLDTLLSDDFVMKARFIDMTITKKDLLGGYMNYFTAFNVSYSPIAVILSGNPEIISVKEYSDRFRFLDVDSFTWNFLIESNAGKITSILMDSAKGAAAYLGALYRKEMAFRTWVEQKYGADTIAVLDREVNVYYDLMAAYALNTPDVWTTQSEEEIEDNEESPVVVTGFRMPCTHFGKLSLKQRMAKYPFNKAKSIMLVSFTDTTILYPDYDRNKQRVLALGNVENKKVLTAADIDQLSDLLFNVGFDTENIYKRQVPECPGLKNAIIFLDDKGKPFDYIGFYFGCNAPEHDINKIQFPVDCDDKYEMLSQFFSERGIRVTGL